MRFDTLNEWKKVNLMNESIDDSLNDHNFKHKVNNKLTNDVIESIKDIVNIAVSEGLPKKQTLEYIKNVYVDPSKAPESVNVSIVRDYMDEIIISLESIKEWPNEDEYFKVIEHIKNEDDLVFKMRTGSIRVLSKNKLYDNTQFEYLKSINAVLLYKNIKWIKQILK